MKNDISPTPQFPAEKTGGRGLARCVFFITPEMFSHFAANTSPCKCIATPHAAHSLINGGAMELEPLVTWVFFEHKSFKQRRNVYWHMSSIYVIPKKQLLPQQKPATTTKMFTSIICHIATLKINGWNLKITSIATEIHLHQTSIFGFKILQ